MSNQGHWIHKKYLEAMSAAVQAVFGDHETGKCAYINIAAMKILHNQFPKEIIGITVGSLAFKNTEGSWDFVFDTKLQNGIFDNRFHLVCLHQVGKKVKVLDFTARYWKLIAREANKIEAEHAAFIDVESVNPKNRPYIYDTKVGKYGAFLEQDREQNAIFHEVLLPRMYQELTMYIPSLMVNYQKILKAGMPPSHKPS